MLLPMLLASCISERIEYRDRVPELVFPPFPSLEGEVVTENGILVPEDWFVRLAEYRLRIEETEKNYVGIRDLYGGEQEE